MTKPLGRKIRDLFFTEDAAAEDTKDAVDGARIFRCRCGETRTHSPQDRGYAIFTEHILSEHEEWLAAAVRGAHVVLAASSKSNGGTKKKGSEAADASGSNSSVEGDDESDSTAALAAPEQASAAPQEVATRKRSDYLPWDDYFMSVAFLSAMRSKDPSTQVGACIVNPDRKIVGIGYNGFPNGCGDDDLPWTRSSASGSPLETKYPYVCHAEMNAILNKNSTDVKGCTIYVALFPCNECAKLIIQSGIARVVYCSDKYRDDWKFVASRRLLDMAGVQCMQHALRQSQLVVDFSSVE